MLLFAISLVLSSFLLFQVQPLIGKYILPWFGSSPSVWSASLLFFQSVLTAGYAYAYWVASRSGLRRQGLIHLGILGLSIIAITAGALLWSGPLLPGDAFQPVGSSHPFLSVFSVLIAAVGFPYFILATNSTLLQSWFNRIYPEKSPYRLYALSNAASLAGLLSYPFLVEPNLPVSAQAWWWTFGYAIFIISIGLIVLRLIRNPEMGILQDGLRIENERLKPPDKFSQSMWVLLPALASILLLATTNQITQEIAVVPFLWVLPLSLYLVSFILCFESDHWYGRGRFTIILFFAVTAFGLMLSKGPLVDLRIQITSYCLVFFVFAMMSHGELANLRPHPQYLTRFYLSISIGGALGGLFVNLLAPVIFKDFWEMPFGLGLSLIVFILLVWVKRYQRSWQFIYSIIIVMLSLFIWLVNFSLKDIQNVISNSLWIERNFFGVIRVREIFVGEEEDPAYRLIHGITVHGMQFEEDEKRQIATTYYTEASGAGLAFKYFLDRGEPIKAGILGLGTGTLAVYGRHGDLFSFYEINPAVIRIAQGKGGYFSFLNDSPATIEIVQGDARLSLEQEMKESGSRQYDLIIVDTFSSDSIPTHLITKEAVGLYFENLKPDGILAIHISNIHLDLEPVVRRLGDEFNKDIALAASGNTKPGSSAAVWMLLGSNPDFFGKNYISHLVLNESELDTNFQLWTDYYSNLFQILR